ncbi:hypothetical protein, partial [uncultured Rhodoblastus sp.]|uniref:hypothetical protein n=1 Tax=uncultured Rhodoblastus sp. TaxID=543037 RepID=UPI0025E441A0
RIAKTQAIASIDPVRGIDARAPRVFADLGDKNHFDSDRRFVPDSNASETKVGCQIPRSIRMPRFGLGRRHLDDESVAAACRSRIRRFDVLALSFVANRPAKI